MKTISMKQPWATLLVCGLKTIECRPWNTKVRGEFLIQASKTIDKDAFYHLKGELDKAQKLDDGALEMSKVTGAIIGRANLVTVKTYHSDTGFMKDHWKHFAMGYFTNEEFAKGKAHGFVITDARRFKSPIPCKGALNFFDLPIPNDVVKMNLKNRRYRC